MAKIIPTFKFSRIFLLSLTFLIFITFIVVTIFSSFIFNNSRIQQIESLYIQAKTIDTLIPQIDEKNINFDEIADSLSITDSDNNELRITISFNVYYPNIRIDTKKQNKGVFYS